MNHLINVKGELPAFLIKPVQRVCKYPLLLDVRVSSSLPWVSFAYLHPQSLIKTLSPTTYSHCEELKRGSEAAKRITDKINEAQRRAENEQTVKSLSTRIEDWKGHHLENFGQLLLDDVFTVTKSDLDREYHVFLFERIILCCKEIPPGQQNGSKKMSKNNSLLKKQASTPTPLNAAAAAAAAAHPHQPRRGTPLLLKGRIFLGNVTQAIPSQPRTSLGRLPVVAVLSLVSDWISGPGMNAQYSLAVWWKGDDDLEYFTLKCRNEEQMRKWESQINRLIKEAAQRRGSDRGLARLNKLAPPSSRSAVSIGNSSTYSYHSSTSYGSGSTALTATSASTKITRSQHGDSHDSFHGYPAGPSPYDPDGFTDDDEDILSATTGSLLSTGRGTPIHPFRKLSSLSMPNEQRETVHDQRARACTEDYGGTTMTQWRNQTPLPQQQQQLVTHSLGGVQRPMTPRTQTDAPFIGQSLRSQLSSSRLRMGYEGGEYKHNRAPTPTHPQPPLKQQYLPQPTQSSRSRSASQPNAYIPQKGTTPPPLPVAHATNWTSRDRERTRRKRGSGSSQSTGDSSEYSPNSSSPVTSFGSSESSLTGIGTHANVNGQELRLPPVKVKVHFHDDIFVIQVPRSMEYDDLVEKVGKKIRLCGPRRDDSPLRVKYRDEDGDMVSLGSTEDVQIAFEAYRPGSQVTLFVT